MLRALRRVGRKFLNNEKISSNFGSGFVIGLCGITSERRDKSKF